MSHLGERVSSLVDGQLSVDLAERALMHITSCGDCREAVETERLMKQRLAALSPPEPADLLVLRLLELAGPSGPLPPRSGHVPGSPRPELVASLNNIAARSNSGNPGWGAEPRGLAARPPGRRGSSRPPVSRSAAANSGLSRMVRVSRSSRNRMAAAMVGAVCLVGVGVAGGVANGGAAAVTPVVPPIDTMVTEHGATSGTLPFADQTVVWGLVGAGK
jgi:hypothetical protein